MTDTIPPKAILFDVDGTLVDTNDLHASAWRDTFRHFGVEIPLEEIRAQIGKGGDNLVPTLIPSASETQRAEMEEYRSPLFRRHYLPRAVPFPGVRPLFERLAADGVKIVLASSSHAAEVAFHLALIGCEDLVAATTTKDDVERSKPCPDIFEAALAEVEPLRAGEVMVIGDSPWDVKAAAKLGIAVVALRCGGFPDDALLQAGACALYDGPRHLLAEYERSPLGKAR